MTGPVNADDLVQGCVKSLLGFPDVRAVLGTYPGTATPYLFQHRLWVTMEGSQSTAAVILDGGGWAGANMHNRMSFPRISLEISADPIRDANNNITDPGEANRRIHAAYKALDARLHRPAGGEQQWGSIRTLDCTRLGEPMVAAVPDGGGLLRLIVAYGVTEG